MNLCVLIVVTFLATCAVFEPNKTNSLGEGDQGRSVNGPSLAVNGKNQNREKSTINPLNMPDRPPIGRNEIVYGRGGGNLLLGDTEERVVTILGAPHDHYVYERPCKMSEWIWIDEKDKGNGITAYFQDGKAFQLKFANSGIKTAEGITFGTPVKGLIELYPRDDQLEEYSLGITDGDFAPDFPRYLVDQKNGVAFKINHRRGETKNEVWAIEIFQPNTDFAPNGCVGDQSKFIKSQTIVIH